MSSPPSSSGRLEKLPTNVRSKTEDRKIASNHQTACPVDKRYDQKYAISCSHSIQKQINRLKKVNNKPSLSSFLGKAGGVDEPLERGK
jgi:hypothetical protein